MHIPKVIFDFCFALKGRVGNEVPRVRFFACYASGSKGELRFHSKLPV